MHRSRMGRLAAVGLVTALGLTACGGDEEVADLEATASESVEVEAGDAHDTADTHDPDDPGGMDDGSHESVVETSDADDRADTGERQEATAAAWPDPIELDVVGRHRAGVIVELFELRVEPTGVEVDLRITNAQGEPAQMHNQGSSMRSTRIRDDLGNTYHLVPPADNEDLVVEEDEVLEGTLFFAGPLPADATALELSFRREVPDMFRGVDNPRRDIRLDIEIPLVEGAEFDDGTDDEGQDAAESNDGTDAGRDADDG